jgi:methylenetetrahydrofolate--tRNA-(uracil-5-)-methyltransferase
MHKPSVHIVGGGLAGSEASYYLAESGIPVILHEMRPEAMTPAHQTDRFAELVCSNSMKSQASTSAPGMLKTEMEQMGSLILSCAKQNSVPAGEALAVDRNLFADQVTQAIRSHPLIQTVAGEVHSPTPGEIFILATGPLTSAGLSRWLATATGSQGLYFYDAIAPIVDASSVDMELVFLANRYGKGDEEAYLNCPMNQSQYEGFVETLIQAETVAPKPFEKEVFFQGCQPIEAIAKSGKDSLRFGPMKPVGLVDPKTGQRPYAVVQLRAENSAATAYNLVGFQTKLKYGDQSRVFRQIPGLNQAEFLRLGAIHRNTYVCGPQVLRPDLSLKGHPSIYLAGQITGVEGYLESAACGMLAALFVQQRLHNQTHCAPPSNTAMGALLRHVTGSNPAHYSPTNMHFGLFDPGCFEHTVGLKRDVLRCTLANQSKINFARWRELEQHQAASTKSISL